MPLTTDFYLDDKEFTVSKTGEFRSRYTHNESILETRNYEKQYKENLCLFLTQNFQYVNSEGTCHFEVQNENKENFKMAFRDRYAVCKQIESNKIKTSISIKEGNNDFS